MEQIEFWRDIDSEFVLCCGPDRSTWMFESLVYAGALLWCRRETFDSRLLGFESSRILPGLWVAFLGRVASPGRRHTVILASRFCERVIISAYQCLCNGSIVKDVEV